VVIAIIGLLSTLAVVALNSARQKARDAKRVADIKQVQTALELYFNDNTQYPAATGDLGVGTMKCLGGGGFASAASEAACSGTTYMGLIPSNPTPTAATAGVYSYSSDGGDSYSITFGLEGTTGGLNKGSNSIYTADQDGIR
ncbi:MAG: hypothetical protein WCW26_05495, partial [Candidatus Buchananbacteria bacterium]